ncbi:endolytic transglycosylase MltG [Patescibacteria group bacterium]|nr:endolytic transglycosylase MltG [Patescibacteria group bacterium]
MERNFIISLACLLVFVFAVFLWSSMYLPLDLRTNKMVGFSIEKGEGAKQISVKLKEQGIIRFSSAFRIYALFSGSSHILQAGEYNLSPSLSASEIVIKMTSGDVVRERITIPEGWDIKKIGQYFEREEICTQQEFEELLKEDFSQGISILSEKPGSLEGYLFPETYEFAKGVSARIIVKKMLSTLDEEFTLEMREEVKAQGRSIDDVIILASIIEKEVKSLEDKKIVSGVLQKRMEMGMLLQVDATIVYMTGRSPVLYADLKIDSPYNTYMYKGLPARPISSPGIDSIIAAIYPTESNYLYYISAPDGRTIFSKTLGEHNAAVRKYLR